MKKSKLWRLIWLLSLNAALAVILYLVVIYKVKWESRDFNTYLYFYECNNSVCSSESKPKTIDSKIICADDVCPYISNFYDNILILTKDNKSWLYDYKKGEVFHDDYINYSLYDNKFYIVTDNNNKQGVMDLNGTLLVENKYDLISEYNYGMISYKENGLFGIDYVSSDKVISPRYDEIQLIDNTMYIAKKDNKYQIYNVVNNSLKDNNVYEYIYAINNFIFTIKNKKLDILNNKLESMLLMKIDTYYDYMTKSQINTLKFKSDNQYIFFNINNGNNNSTEYKFNIKDGKISINK